MQIDKQSPNNHALICETQLPLDLTGLISLSQLKMMGVFYSRRFFFIKHLENYINYNKIGQQQIVSITNTAGNDKSGQFVSYSILYFFLDTSLEYDLFDELSDQQQNEIKIQPIETEQENEREERLLGLRGSLHFHKNSANWSLKLPEEYHNEEIRKIELELNEIEGVDYGKVINLDYRYIVPVNFVKYQGTELLDFIIKLNPKSKIETKWIYLK